MAAKNHGVIAPARADKIRIAIQMNAVLPGVGNFRDLALSTLLKPLRGLTAFWVTLDTGRLSEVLETAIVIFPFWIALHLWQPRGLIVNEHQIIIIA
jgi:hypothetical protein